jgi:chitin synthase
MDQIQLQTQKAPVVKESLQRRQWKCLTWSLTWWIPTYCIRKFGKMTHPEVIMAWREKVALCIIIMFCCALLLFYIIGLGTINLYKK